MDHHLESGQVYLSCTPAGGPPRYVRILAGGPSRKRVTIVNAATSQQQRDIDARRLHPYPVGPRGSELRSGYVHTETREWMNYLTDQALRGHPFTIIGSSIGQDPWRGGVLRLHPEAATTAVRAVVAALETAAWTVEASTAAGDELRVRLGGKDTCPATRSEGGRWYCGLYRGHRDEHRDNETLGVWDAAPEQAGLVFPLSTQGMPL